jgi:hypothetical protein
MEGGENNEIDITIALKEMLPEKPEWSSTMV